MIKLLPFLLLAALSAPADLAPVAAEPNPVRRAHLALDNAGVAYQQAREAYRKSDLNETQAALKEVQQSVELAHTALEETGRSASRHPKEYKYCELRTRDLLRRLSEFELSMEVNDRPMADVVKIRVQEIHDDWLEGIMSKKK